MNKYTMVFALSPDYGRLLMLHKPTDHKNPEFRDKWTVPGGHIDLGETELAGAEREMVEETGLSISGLIRVLDFTCDCDFGEGEHRIVVYGVVLPAEVLLCAIGSMREPVKVFYTDVLPIGAMWNTEALLRLTIGRLKQVPKS